MPNGNPFSSESLRQIAQQQAELPPVEIGPSKPKGKHDKMYRVAQAALLGANAFDYLSTSKALNTPTQPGVTIKEGNPLYGDGNPSRRALVKALTVAPQMYLMHNMKENQHEKAAVMTGLIGSILPTIFGINNLRLANKHKAQ